MIEKCAICGDAARFFTDTYDPIAEKNHVITLCGLHQAMICDRIIHNVKMLQAREEVRK